MILCIDSINWTAASAIFTLLTVIVGIFYTYYTYQLLKANNEIKDKANLINKFNTYKIISDSICNDTTEKLIDYCTNTNFQIDQTNRQVELNYNGNIINKSDIEYKLLNKFEDIAIFYGEGLIDLNTLSNAFGYKILNICNSVTIRQHISQSRQNRPTLYTGLESLYADILQTCSEQERTNYRTQLID